MYRMCNTYSNVTSISICFSLAGQERYALRMMRPSVLKVYTNSLPLSDLRASPENSIHTYIQKVRLGEGSFLLSIKFTEV